MRRLVRRLRRSDPLGPLKQYERVNAGDQYRPPKIQCGGTRDEQSEKLYLNSACTRKSKGLDMHYRNGREANNGDKIVKLNGGEVVAFGVLYGAVPGNDYCNGSIAWCQPPQDYACLCDCLHVDDVAEVLAEKSLDKRPQGK